MRHSISASTFIRDCFAGAFCVFESMASFLPFVEDMTVLDLGSTDGTLQALREIAEANPRIKVVESHFARVDAASFAIAANEAVAQWKHPQGLFWYADEIWHEDLLQLMDKDLSDGVRELSFWRYQLRDNFQVMSWPPHPIHRVGIREQFTFVDEGTNTNRTWDAKICSNWNGGWFTRWGTDFGEDYTKLPTNEMVMDVGAIGGFIENIVQKRKMHAPFWHESPNVRGEPAGQWYIQERSKPIWTKGDTPYNIPHIMRYHVGKTQYNLRPELLEALKADETRSLLGYD